MIVYTHTKKIKVPLFLFLLTCVVAGYFSSLGVDPHHDGIMFKPALDVARGSMLFRDTFAQYGAITTLLQAWALVIFGKYLLTIRLATAFFYGLIAALLYVIYQRILPKFLSGITVLLWIFMAPYFLVPFLPWASVYALFFQLSGTYFLIKYEERANFSYLFWAGVATSATFFTRQPGGVFMAGAVYAYLFGTFIAKSLPLPKFIRALYLVTCGVALTASCFLIWIAGNGSFRDYWLQSIQFAYNFGAHRPNATIHGVLLALFPGGGSPISLWTLLPAATILVSLIYFIALARKHNIKQAKAVLAIAAIGLSAWLQYYPVADERHMYWGGTQMFGLLTLALFAVCGYVRRKPAIVLTCVLLAYFFAPYISLRVTTGMEKLRAGYVTVSKPDILSGMLMPAPDAEFYSSIAGNMDLYFQNNPRGNVINLSGDALYMAFDPRIRNIHPVYIAWRELSFIYPDYFSGPIYAYVQTNKSLVITNGLTWIPDGYCPLVKPPYINPIVLSLPCP
jgi:hypothetical protein